MDLPTLRESKTPTRSAAMTDATMMSVLVRILQENGVLASDENVRKRTSRALSHGPRNRSWVAASVARRCRERSGEAPPLQACSADRGNERSMTKTATALRDTGDRGEKHRRTSSATGATPRDTEFCSTILPRVSRTFALSIAALPDSLRAAVRSSYLHCRVVDSIEDEPTLEGAHRNELFDIFDRLLDDGADAAELELACARASVGGTGADGELCRGAGAVFRTFRALPPSQRNTIRPHVLEMSGGMRSY